MFNSRLINTKVAGGGGGCTDIVDNYDPFGDSSGVALYQLNGNANDVSGNYSFSTTSNVSYENGVFDQALDLNSSSSYATGTGLTITFPLTFSFWVKPDSSALAVGLLINKRTTATNGFSITGTLNKMGFLNNGGYAGGSDGVAANLTSGSWYHITVVINTSGWTSYVNGQYYNNYVGSLNNNSNEVRLGKSSNIGNWVGSTWSIDQLRVFNRELDPLEIEALYKEELCICGGTVDTLDILGDGSCIATYQLDGNANDLSGNYSGTPTDVSYGVGEFDLAGVFNGSSSGVNLPEFSALNSTDFSVSVWFNHNSADTTTSNNRIIQLNCDSDGDAGLLDVMFRQSTFAFTIRSGINSTDVLTYTSNSTELPDNVFNHIAITRDKTSNITILYINGVNVKEQTQAEGSNIGSFSSIGVRTFGDLHINGSIDQVRIFNKALSAGEVTTLYNESACTKAACTGTTNTLDILGDSSCIAAYPLDGSPLDLSGNYNGIQTNVTYPQGYFDLAGSFNNGYIDLGRDSNGLSGVLNQKVSQSVSFWMNASSPGLAGNSVIYSVYAGGGISLNIYYFADGTLYFFTRYSNVSTDYQTVQTFNDSQWHHIAVSIDIPNLQRKVYIDNILVSTQSLPSNSYGAAGTDIGVAIGTNGNFNTQYYNGRLDQLRIFNKPITASEVTTLYNETPCN